MKRVAFAFACLLSAVPAWAGPSPDILRRAVRLMREIRQESLNPVKNIAPLRAKLGALRKEAAAATDPTVLARLKADAEGLDCLETGRPLPPPDGEEAAADAPPIEPEPAPVSREILRDAVAAVPPAAAAAYFDLSLDRGGEAPAVSEKAASRPAGASLDKYLTLTGDEERRAHLKTVTADLFAKLRMKDPGNARALILAARLHEHLSKHAQRDQFASLALNATDDSHLHLIYRLKSGLAGDEDLGLIEDWSTVKTGKGGRGGGGGGGGGGGSKKSGKKGAKGGDGDDDGDGGGSSKKKSKGGGGSKSRGGKKGGGSSGGGGDDGGGSAASGGGRGKGARAPKKRGGAAMFDGGEDGGGNASSGGGRGGKAGRGSKRGFAGAERGSSRVKGGHRLASGEGGSSASSANKSDHRVPLPKGFPVRRDRLDAKPGASGGAAKSGKGGSAGGDSGGESGGRLGGKSKSYKGSVPVETKAPAPNHALTAGGSAPVTAPAAAAVGAAPASRPASASAPLHAPEVGSEDALHDAVAAHAAPASVPVADHGARVPAPAPVDDPLNAGTLALGAVAAGLGALALRAKASVRRPAVTREESV